MSASHPLPLGDIPLFDARSLTHPVPQQSLEQANVTEWNDGAVRRLEDWIAAEEPLEIRAGGKVVTVTMRTPGHDTELAAGFLLTEGLIESADQLIAVRQPQGGGRSNVVEAELRDSALEVAKIDRNFISASACGVCGKASIEAIRRRNLQPPNAAFRVDPELLCRLPDRLRGGQQIFGRTGGLHAAAAFDADGNLLAVREDIGRHNAVDKLVGWALLQGLLPLSCHVLLVSGRAGFEIVQKAIAAGIPVLAAVSAPSSLAVQLARELDLTVAGFLRGRRFVAYSAPWRCVASLSQR